MGDDVCGQKTSVFQGVMCGWIVNHLAVTLGYASLLILFPCVFKGHHQSTQQQNKQKALVYKELHEFAVWAGLGKCCPLSPEASTGHCLFQRGSWMWHSEKVGLY